MATGVAATADASDQKPVQWCPTGDSVAVLEVQPCAHRQKCRRPWYGAALPMQAKGPRTPELVFLDTAAWTVTRTSEMAVCAHSHFNGQADGARRLAGEMHQSRKEPA